MKISKEKGRLIKIIRSKGIEVFGGEDKFNNWMDKENYILGYIKPKVYLNTIADLEILLNEIYAIEFGSVV
jgi:uncharacterized protein (DUF2384 family)